jgi:hypothetical protein
MYRAQYIKKKQINLKLPTKHPREKLRADSC